MFIFWNFEFILKYDSVSAYIYICNQILYIYIYIYFSYVFQTKSSVLKNATNLKPQVMLKYNFYVTNSFLLPVWLWKLEGTLWLRWRRRRSLLANFFSLSLSLSLCVCVCLSIYLFPSIYSTNNFAQSILFNYNRQRPIIIIYFNRYR